MLEPLALGMMSRGGVVEVELKIAEFGFDPSLKID